MSYILDALRRSEQQRQLGATPTLNTVAAPAAERERHRRWRAPVIAVALAGLAFAAGWRQPWRTEPASPAVGSIASVPSAVMQPSPATPAEPADDAPKAAQAAHAPGAAQTTEAPTPAQEASAASTRPEPRSTAAAQPAGTAAPRHVATATAPARGAEVAKAESGDKAVRGQPQAERKAENAVLALAELPPALRAELPAMTITVHSYSPTAAERLVGVNNRFLHEGDPLSPELVLEKITPDGMVFNYKGTRFHRGLR